MAIIDKIPMQTTVVMALFLGLAPFMPEPHVLEKMRMLMAGTLVQPIDIGDLLFHIAPSLLLIAKLMRLPAGGNK